MALVPGDKNATAGMAKAIYEQIDSVMKDDIPSGSLEDVRKGWRKLAYAVAAGVIEHITSNMEVYGVLTGGDISAAVSGNTGTAAPGNHAHAVNLSATQAGVTFTQSNDGTGHVR